MIDHAEIGAVRNNRWLAQTSPRENPATPPTTRPTKLRRDTGVRPAACAPGTRAGDRAQHGLVCLLRCSLQVTTPWASTTTRVRRWHGAGWHRMGWMPVSRWPRGSWYRQHRRKHVTCLALGAGSSHATCWRQYTPWERSLGAEGGCNAHRDTAVQGGPGGR